MKCKDWWVTECPLTPAIESVIVGHSATATGPGTVIYIPHKCHFVYFSFLDTQPSWTVLFHRLGSV